MTLQQLYYFVEACRYGNISHAANDIGISQPSVSTAIKSLEEEFEVRLIKRNQSGFGLTEEGALFLDLATSLLDHANGITKTMINVGKKKNIVRLGITSTTMDFSYSEILGPFTNENPEIEIATKSASGVSLLHDLSNDLLDMALVAHIDELPMGCVAIPVGTLEVVCCVAPDHPLAIKEKIMPEDLKDMALSLPVAWYSITQLIQRFMNKKGIEPKIMNNTNDTSAIKILIAQKRSIGILYRQTANLEKDIVAIPFADGLYSDFTLVMKKNAYMTDAMHKFIEHIKKMDKSLWS